MLLITVSKIDKWGKEKNFAKLVESLQNNNDEVRKAAALCLGRIGDSSVLDSLEYAFHNDTDIFVKKDIESAIGLIKAKKYISGKPIFNEKTIDLKPVYNLNIKVSS